MTTKPHPYAEILRAIADGERIQIIPLVSEGRWEDRTAEQALEILHCGRLAPTRMRVKPRTLTINGYEVPEPLREMPPEGATVYWPGFGPDSGDDNTERANVGYYPTMLPDLLDKGLLHLTRQAAIAHAKALVSFTARAT